MSLCGHSKDSNPWDVVGHQPRAAVPQSIPEVGGSGMGLGTTGHGYSLSHSEEMVIPLSDLQPRCWCQCQIPRARHCSVEGLSSEEYLPMSARGSSSTTQKGREEWPECTEKQCWPRLSPWGEKQADYKQHPHSFFSPSRRGGKHLSLAAGMDQPLLPHTWHPR